MKRITEEQWLKYHGFRHFPFDRPDAGAEYPDFLASYFVQPNGFERVLGYRDAPVTSLLFAARGAGKTACRVMVDYFCRKGLVPAGNEAQNQLPYVLSIPHIYLSSMIEELVATSSTIKKKPLVRVEHHVQEILRRAVTALVKLIAETDNLRDQIRDLSVANQQDLWWLVFHYGHYLSSPERSFLASMGLGETTSQSPSWADILFEKRSQVSALDHLGLWSTLVHQLGIAASYVLIDGVDEYLESADDPYYALQVILPLLSSRRLMDQTPYLALKFFLPTALEMLVQEESSVRLNLGFPIVTIAWQKPDLINMLRLRLKSLRISEGILSEHANESFDDLCVPELRGQIEDELVGAAEGNPRALLMLCGLMIRVHCDREISEQDDPYQLNREDFSRALTLFNNVVVSKPT